MTLVSKMLRISQGLDGRSTCDSSVVQPGLLLNIFKLKLYTAETMHFHCHFHLLCLKQTECITNFYIYLFGHGYVCVSHLQFCSGLCCSSINKYLIFSWGGCHSRFLWDLQHCLVPMYLQLLWNGWRTVTRFFSATCRCVILEQSTKKTVLIMDCRNGRRRQLAVEYSFS